jgi:GntR family transcriptional regulator, rspAB operon transcriptional repressor
MESNVKSVQALVYDILKNNILNLQLKPGTIISTQEIATKLQVSRTPVREAFIRLQKDSLVNIYPQKETIVSRINLNRVREERFIRESLECSVLDAVIKNRTITNITMLRENIEQQQSNVKKEKDYIRHIRLDNEFHELLFAIGNQPLSWNTIQNVSAHYARIRLITVWTDEILKTTILQHQKIVTAIEEGALAYAREYMHEHLRRLETEIDDIVKAYPDFFEITEKTKLQYNMLLSL